MSKKNKHNILYIISLSTLKSSKSNGIRSQALDYFRAVDKSRFNIVLANPWDEIELEEFKVVHIFGYGLWIYNFINKIKRDDLKIIVSPIIDSIKNPILWSLSTRIGYSKINLFSHNYALSKSSKFIDLFLVRSEHEKKYLTTGMNINTKKINKIPVIIKENSSKTNLKKKNYCFHASSIYQKRKNVVRLIKAAIKYKFDLILAGKIGSEKNKFFFETIIGENKNIKMLGFVSNEKLQSLYSEAKVFAYILISQFHDLLDLKTQLVQKH